MRERARGGVAKPAQQVDHERRGRGVLTPVRRAAGTGGRFKGLMLRGGPLEGRRLLIQPARGIQTRFMRFPGDLVFLDRTDTVGKVRNAMPARRLDFANPAAAIEVNRGGARANGIRPGDRLRCEPAGDGA